jgi:hypothetical protein
MAGRFGSKFKKRTSHNTSNIRTQSSPTVSKPISQPKTKVSKPTPVRTTPHGSTLTSNVVNTLSHNPFTIQKATAQEPYDTNIAAADEGTKFQDVSKMSLYDKDDPTQIHPEKEWNIFDPTTWFGSGTSPSTYNPVDAAADNTDNTDGQADPLATYTKENPFTDGEDLPHATKNTIADAVIPAYTDEDGKIVEEKTIPYSDFAPGYHGGEVVGKTGAEIGIINDYITGEQRKSYYHPGSVSAEDHQAALDRQAVGQYQNYIQKDYFNQITSGNMNDDMMKGLHNKIESSALPAAFKQEIWDEYDTKRTDYKSRSTYGGYEGLGSNTTHKTGKVDGVQASNWDFGNITSWKPSKAEKIKAKIDKEGPLSVEKADMAKFMVFTGQNMIPGGNYFDNKFLKIDDKKNKPIWFDYENLGY